MTDSTKGFGKKIEWNRGEQAMIIGLINILPIIKDNNVLNYWYLYFHNIYIRAA